MLYDGNGRKKNRNTIKRRNETKEKISALVPSHPLSTKWRPTVFRCPKTPKTSRTYPKWERDPRLMGQKIQVWARYGQLTTDGINYIHVKFQDLQQKRTGVRVEVEK